MNPLFCQIIKFLWDICGDICDILHQIYKKHLTLQVCRITLYKVVFKVLSKFMYARFIQESLWIMVNHLTYLKTVPQVYDIITLKRNRNPWIAL